MRVTFDRYVAALREAIASDPLSRPPTDGQIAAEIGISRTMVVALRLGTAMPSIPVAAKIRDWSVATSARLGLEGYVDMDSWSPPASPLPHTPRTPARRARVA